MSLTQLALLIIASSVIISVAGFLALRPVVKRFLHPANELVYCFMGATGAIYALALGLFAVATWDSLKAAEDTTTHEALQVSKLFTDLAVYPAYDRDLLRPMLRQYLITVIDDEWKKQQNGETPKDPKVLRELGLAWIKVDPTTESQKILHAAALNQLNELFSLRQQRLQAVQGHLPSSLWVVILFGAFLNIGIGYLVDTERIAMHLVLVAILAGMIGTMIFVIVAVDHPFLGGLSVSTESYCDVLHETQTAATPLGNCKP